MIRFFIFLISYVFIGTALFAAASAATTPGRWYSVAEGIFVSVSEFEENNMTLVTSEGKAILIDTGYRTEEARRVKEYLESNNIVLTAIINTHLHPDHIGNNHLFQLPAAAIHQPSNTPDGTEFRVGVKTLRVIHTPGHHPKGDMGVFIVENNIFAAGDILYTCLPPQLSYGSEERQVTPTLEMLRDRHFATVIPGHGRVLNGDELIAMSLNYIAELKRRIRALIDAGFGPNQKSIPLAECIAHADWMLPGVAEDLHINNCRMLYQIMRP